MAREVPTECPICHREPGDFRDGACSFDCDRVMGSVESVGAIFAVWLAFALVAVALYMAWYG